jgi:hypothetical protein
MSDPAIGTMSVRFSAEERRLLEDFAKISGVTVEGLIREALFLPPLEARARPHLRLVRGGPLARGEANTPALGSSPVWPRRQRSTTAPSAALHD